MWKHALVSQRCQSDFALCSPVQEDVAAALSKPLPQGKGWVALHPSIFSKEIWYREQNSAFPKKAEAFKYQTIDMVLQYHSCRYVLYHRCENCII